MGLSLAKLYQPSMEIPFFRPNIGPTVYQNVAKVLESGWLTTGPITEQFEKEFAEYVGADYAVMLTSCTAALHLALISIGIKPGDEVITTPYTFAATAEVIEYLGAKPVFVDIREDTYNIDETLVEKNITPKTKAILPVHFGGHPCEMDTLLNMANKHGLKVIEDAAHCTPAFYKGKPIGSLGDVTCFSFYANKCITTGEGGMFTSNNKDFIQEARTLRLHGLSKDAINRFKATGSWQYDITRLGYKYNPTDLSAAIGLAQLESVDHFYQRRRNIAQQYQEKLKENTALQLPIQLDNIDSAWHLYVIQLKNPWISSRDQIINQLKEKGIGTSVHYIPIHMHSYYRNKYNYKASDFPVAHHLFQSTLSLPLYPDLTGEQVEYICSHLNGITR